MAVGDLDPDVRGLESRQEAPLWLLPPGLPAPRERGRGVNKRYRKQMRLKSRHYRQGHNRFCKCWELWQNFALAIKRRMESGEPLPRRRVRRWTPDS